MKPFFLVAALVAAPHFAKAQDTKAEDDCGCNAAEAAAPDTVQAAKPANDKVLLRLNLKPGQKYSQRMDMDNRSTTVSKTMRIAVTQKMSIDLDNEVLSISPTGNVEIRTSFRDIKMTVDVKLDGKPAPRDNQSIAGMKAILDAMKGKSMVVTASPRAEVLKTAGAKEFIDAVFKAIPTKTKAERANVEAMGKAMVKGLTDSKEGMMRTGTLLPEKPVGLSDSWQEERKSKMLQNEVTTTSNYKIISLEGGVALADVQTKMLMKNVGKSVAGQPQLNMDGKIAGTIDFDVATGLTRKSALKTYSTTRMSMMKNGKPDPTMASTTYSNSTTSFVTSAISQ